MFIVLETLQDPSRVTGKVLRDERDALAFLSDLNIYVPERSLRQRHLLLMSTRNKTPLDSWHPDLTKGLIDFLTSAGF